MFGLQLIGDPCPLDKDAIAPFSSLAKSYLELMTTWGPGRAMGYVELLDPRGAAFSDLQMRFHLHGPHQKAMGRWTGLHKAVLAEGVVIGRTRYGGAVVGFGDQVIVLNADGTDRSTSSFHGAFEYPSYVA